MIIYTIYGMLREGQEYKIYMMVEPDGVIPLVDFIADIESANYESAVAIIAHLKKARQSHLHGPPLTKALRGNMKGIYEIRCLSVVGKIRLPFVFAKDQRIIVMTGILKKAKQFSPSQEKQIRKHKMKLDKMEATYEEFDFTIFEE